MGRRVRIGSAGLVRGQEVSPRRAMQLASAAVASALGASALVLLPNLAVAAAAAASAPGEADVTARPDSVSAMLSARLLGHRVEDASQESEDGHTYANPDGTWTTDEYSVNRPGFRSYRFPWPAGTGWADSWAA